MSTGLSCNYRNNKHILWHHYGMLNNTECSSVTANGI